MDRKLTAALVAEAIGTFLFFFIGCGAVVLTTYLAKNGADPGSGAGLLIVAFAHGIVLAVLVSAFGAISGGHFNPAVTTAIAILGKIPPARAAAYVIAQLVGAVAAGLVLRFLFTEEIWRPTNIGVPALGAGVGAGSGIAIEAILTTILVFTVLGTAVDARGPRIGGLAIGLAIGADILMGGPLTGAAMNPARWFGPAVAAVAFDNWYVWIAGPLLGAAIAAIVYRYLFWAPASEATV